MHDAMRCAALQNDVRMKNGVGNGFVSPKSISDVPLYVNCIHLNRFEAIVRNDLHTFLWG